MQYHASKQTNYKPFLYRSPSQIILSTPAPLSRHCLVCSKKHTYTHKHRNANTNTKARTYTHTHTHTRTHTHTHTHTSCTQILTGSHLSCSLLCLIPVRTLPVSLSPCPPAADSLLCDPLNKAIRRSSVHDPITVMSEQSLSQQLAVRSAQQLKDIDPDSRD